METDELDRAVRRHIYEAFIDHGRPPVPLETANALGRSEYEIESAYRRLAENRAIVLASGSPYVMMANPLCALPTPFDVEVGNRAYWGTCIWDALGIPAMLDARNAVVRAACGDCGEPLTLEIENTRPPAVDWVLHFAVPAAHWWDDIGFT